MVDINGDTNNDIEVTVTTEWQRFTVKGTHSQPYRFFDIKFFDNGEFHFWGGQLEQLPFASSYMPTTSSAVSRAVDICSLAYAGNAPDKNKVMSILCDVTLLGLNTVNQAAWKIDGETNRLLHAHYPASNAVILFHGGSGYSSAGVLTPLEATRLGVTFDGVNNRLYVDGVLQDADAQVSPVGGTAIDIKLGLSLFGHLTNFRIYDVTLTENEMTIA